MTITRERDWYVITEQPSPAPRLVHPEGCAALHIVLVTVHLGSRSCEIFRMDWISTSYNDDNDNHDDNDDDWRSGRGARRRGARGQLYVIMMTRMIVTPVMMMNNDSNYSNDDE